MEKDYISVHSLLEELDKVLHDEVLEEQGRADFYWDTSDVRNALLGQAAYYDVEISSSGRRVESFQAGSFNHDRALIRSLQAAGYFGPLRMLQPHQAEFYRLINRNFDQPLDVPIGGISKFLDDVAIKGLDGGLVDFSDLPPERVDEIVTRQVGSAPKLFKVVQCIRLGNWKSRLNAWIEQGQLQLDDEPYNYRELVSMPEFKSLKETFDGMRDDRQVNNFADAVALCQLIQKIRDCDNDHGKPVPRFYLTPFYKQSLPDAPRDRRFFCHRDGDQSVFRETNYYKLRATLNACRDPEARCAADETLSAVRAAREQVAQIGRAQDPLKTEVLERVKVHGHTVAEIMGKLRDYWFLEAIWLPFSAKKEVANAIMEHVEIVRRAEDIQILHHVLTDKVQKALRELEERNKDYQNIKRLWSDLELAGSRLLDGSGDTDLFTLSGLLRFGFAEESDARIVAILEMAAQESTRNEALLDLFQWSQRLSPQGSSLEDFEVVGGIMWALEMDSWIVRELKQICSSGHCHCSLRVLLGAACFRYARPSATGLSKAQISKLGKEQIDRLESEYNAPKSDEDKVNLGIGLGYLCFHYSQNGAEGQAKSNERHSFVQKASRYAQEVLTIDAGKLRKKAYAANQHLFYMLHAEPLLDWEEISRVAARLAEFEHTQDWQYRFNDTLAYYFDAASDREEDETERKRLRAAARTHMDFAIKVSGGRDPEVNRHNDRMLLKRQSHA